LQKEHSEIVQKMKQIYSELEPNLEKENAKKILLEIFKEINAAQDAYKKLTDEEKEKLKMNYREKLFRSFDKMPPNPFIKEDYAEAHKIMAIEIKRKIFNLNANHENFNNEENNLNSAEQLIISFICPLFFFAGIDQTVDFTNSDFRKQIIFCLNSLKEYYGIQDLEELKLDFDLVPNDKIINAAALYWKLQFSYSSSFKDASLSLCFILNNIDDLKYKEIENRKNILNSIFEIGSRERFDVLKNFRFETYDFLHQIDFLEKFIYNVEYEKINLLKKFNDSIFGPHLNLIFHFLNGYRDKKIFEDFFALDFDSFKDSVKDLDIGSYLEKRDQPNFDINKFFADQIIAKIEQENSKKNQPETNLTIEDKEQISNMGLKK
jgi:hypothetical protein